jgi:predicted phosphodiesterase/transposase-like protein
VPQRPLSRELAQEALDIVARYKTVTEAATVLGISDGTLRGRLRAAKRQGLKPKEVKEKIGKERYVRQIISDEELQKALDEYTRGGGNAYATSRKLGIDEKNMRLRLTRAQQKGMQPRVKTEFKEPEIEDLKRVVLGSLKHGSETAESLANRLKTNVSTIHEVCRQLHAHGHNIMLVGSTYSIEKMIAQVAESEDVHVYESDDTGNYRFGVVSDTHLGSKYYRADVLNDLYQWFKREGITRVYHAGNWIEGEARFNKQDISVHGMDAQCRYMAAEYPRVEGLVTYAVTGDDHEGWYAQREGIDIGRYMERTMVDAGRGDWKNLGYMEAFIKLRHRHSHNTSQMLVMHPGGGSAYALSYQPQKIVESLAGGEKPAVLLVGHYHKMEFLNVRNTWVLQCGCTKDQDPFLRKKRIEVHIGGTIMELQQNEQGAVPDAKIWLKRYFNVGYYQDRFSHTGPVVLPSMTSGAR